MLAEQPEECIADYCVPPVSASPCRKPGRPFANLLLLLLKPEDVLHRRVKRAANNKRVVERRVAPRSSDSPNRRIGNPCQLGEVGHREISFLKLFPQRVPDLR